jgi:Na+/melibiose symporter-like transporter
MILFLSIVIGIFLFMIVAILVGQTRGPLMPDLNKHHTTIAIIMAVVSFVCLLFAKQQLTSGVQAAKNSLNPLSEKLNMHRNALIKYLFICEMPVFLSIIIFMLTGNFIFQIYAAVFIGFMLTVMPTRKKIAEDLGLGTQERQELEA